MLAVLFTNALMLASLGALAIPVVIHLLLRQRRKRQRFSTLQFFAKLEEQSSQRRKLRNWFLLAMRLMLFALLALAFARPYFPKAANAGTPPKRRQIIIVLDRSLSMAAFDPAGQRWVRALNATRKILTDLRQDDRAALISCAAQSEVLSGFAPPTVVANLLKDLQPTYASANISQGLQRATKLLELVDPSAASAIYVISDLQRNSCPNLGSFPIPQPTDVKILSVGDVFAPNMAVTDLKLEGQMAPKLRVGLGNFSDEDSTPSKVSFLVDGQEALTRAVNLKAGAATNLDVLLPSLRPGWHSIEARLLARDALAADNVRYQTVFVPQPVRVLLVETRSARRVFEEETFFLATALDPAMEPTNLFQTGFLFEKITPADLAKKLSSRTAARAWDMVMLPGLKEVPASTGKVLADFVQAGGSVMFFLGDGISMNRYMTEFRDLLPAQLDRLESEPDSSLKWRIGDYETNSAIFAAFRLPNSGNLALAEFTRRFMVTMNGDSFVAAYFDDGVPLVVSRTVGRGKVALVNTSADTSWTDWPKHKTFVPWLHGLGRYLAGDSHHDLSHNRVANLISGDDTEVQIEPSLLGQTFQLQTPAGRQIAGATDARGFLRTDLTAPGIYILRNSSGAEAKRFAVNVPREEADLAALLPNERSRTEHKQAGKLLG